MGVAISLSNVEKWRKEKKLFFDILQDNSGKNLFLGNRTSVYMKEAFLYWKYCIVNIDKKTKFNKYKFCIQVKLVLPLFNKNILIIELWNSYIKQLQPIEKNCARLQLKKWNFMLLTWISNQKTYDRNYIKLILESM